MEIRDEVLGMLQKLAAPDEPLPPGIDDDEIDGFESRTGLNVPPELRELWHVTNGACVAPDGIFGIGTSREVYDVERFFYRQYPQWRKRGWIPVSGDGCGNYYVLSTTGEFGPRVVFFVDVHENASEPTYVVASGIWHFFRSLFRAELGPREWPFNSRVVLADDPDIVNCRGIKLPWQT